MLFRRLNVVVIDGSKSSTYWPRVTAVVYAIHRCTYRPNYRRRLNTPFSLSHIGTGYPAKLSGGFRLIYSNKRLLRSVSPTKKEALYNSIRKHYCVHILFQKTIEAQHQITTRSDRKLHAARPYYMS
jgi:hypothetical protein